MQAPNDRPVKMSGWIRYGFAALALLLAAACHDGPFDEPAAETQHVPATIPLADLRALAGDGPTTVTGDLAVSGTVTSTDRRRAFYQTLCIESDGAALQILAGLERLFVDYPPGCRVTLRLRGLTLGTYRGVLQAGTQPEPGSYYPTGYLASPAAVAAHLTRLPDPLQPVVPTVRRIGELTPGLCGTLVRIEGLAPVVSDEPAAPVPWSGTHAFADEAGNTVYSYVRSGALFADDPIPSGRCALTGILLYDSASGGRYLIQLRDETDCSD